MELLCIWNETNPNWDDEQCAHRAALIHSFCSDRHITIRKFINVVHSLILYAATSNSASHSQIVEPIVLGLSSGR
jgi:hypothetical protein